MHFPTTQETECPKKLCETMASCLCKFVQQKGVQFPEANMTSQTNMTARNLRQFGKRQLPPLLSEYWLVADESSANHFQDFKYINKVPPISENGGEWKGVCGNETEWYKKIEERYASRPGTLVLKSKDGKKDTNWCGVFRNPKQAVEDCSLVKMAPYTM